MSPISRAARTFILSLPLLALAAPPAEAKPVKAGRAGAGRAVTAAQPVPWLYKGSDVPPDREWVFGQLANGMRYAVRRNGVPPGQVSIRIRMDVGSLYETPPESGFAHLLEHLVFRQSKYLAEGEAIPIWQRLGATFGSDTNAETTPTQTVFKLDLPNVSPASLDESFKLLSGMMAAPTLSEANIRTEVPIVMAEMRERGGTAQRVADATRETLYKGQPLADHAPIGTVATLEGAHQDAVRAFHARWYRPENAVVIASGDIDPAQLEALVQKWFGDWRSAGKPTPAPSFGDPVAPAGADPKNPVGETRVIVEPDLARGMTWAILRPWRKVNDTIVYNQGLMVDALAQALINRRLEARARAGGSYLAAQVNQEDVSRSVDGTFVSVTPLTPDWQAALRDVRAVIADALATPPTKEEIDREVAEMNVAFESSVEQRSLIPGAKVADDLVQALDIRETVASPETVHKIFHDSIPLFTPQAVLAHTRTLFSGTVTRSVYLTPKAGEGDAAALKTAMAAPVVADGSARLSTKPISFAEMPALGTAAQPTAVTPTGLLGIEQVDFANGVKVLMWPTPDDPGRATVKVRFGGGYRSFASGDAPYVALGQMALVGSGEGSLGQEELDRISTGRKMGFDFKIEDTAFEFSADTRPSDIEDQIYLFAAKFATPRWDASPVIRAKAALALQYESYATSPQGVLERDLKYLERNRDPRFHTPTPVEIQAATPEGFRQVWQPLLAQGPIEVQVFGDFDRAKVLAQLGRTFGALPARPPLPASTQPATAQFPVGSDQAVVLRHHGDANQAAAIVAWPTGGGMAGIRESRQLQILADLFTNRLMDAMREKTGASYAPQVMTDWPLDLQDGGSISAMAQLKPEAVPLFFQTAQEIAAELVAKPASADELARVTEPLRQQVTRASTSSAFFMFQLENATQDPSRIAAIRTLLGDYTQTTPEKMQALAQRYFAKGTAWKLAVIPEGQPLATRVEVAPGKAEGR
ncbi:MAG: insulinase family protein [Sphingomonadales bacterium]|nr:insulinase family protein [Sphingomonadales bacterium]